MSVPDYYNRINPDLLQAIPQGARAILEVGCGAGALGATYKSFDPACRYVGVELFAEAAAIAETRLDRVIRGDVETLDLVGAGIAPGSLDVILYGDLLEHLREPGRVLAEHVRLLRPGGSVAACIPNAQHWTLIARLIRGDFRYTDQGLLDRTHLRFFTEPTMIELFEGAGLSVERCQPRPTGRSEFESFLPSIRPALERLGVDEAEFRRRAQALQFIVRGVKGRLPKPLRVTMILTPQKVCHRVRVLDPVALMRTQPNVDALSAETIKVDRETPRGEKVIIHQRRASRYPEDVPAFRKAHDAGYLCVAETDDDPLRFPHHLENRFLTYRANHAIQVSTEPLAGYMRKLNPNVAVFENQLTRLPRPRRLVERERVRVFFGALNREDDWAPLLDTLKERCARFGDRLEFAVLHDRRLADALAPTRVEFEPFCEYERYVEVLRTCDLALLPLEPNRFNEMKSDLKFLECAAEQVAVLASPTVYEKTAVDGESALIFRSPEEFGRKFDELVTSLSLRVKLTENARRYVAGQRMLAQHIHKRVDWYRQLLGRLDELDREVRERCPELWDPAAADIPWKAPD